MTHGYELGVDRTAEERAGKILTSTGRLLDVFNPQPRDLDIRDIAAGLSKACRYAGQIPNGIFYSVAQHSILVSRRFEGAYTRMTALLHDAEEAYLGDLCSPIKVHCPEFARVGDRLRVAILDKFSVAFNPEDGLSENIHEADDAVYRLERLSFWHPEIENEQAYEERWGSIDPALRIRPWTHITAEAEFLREFDQINQALERMKDGR
jgi:5'-deoxynucleotidase YfbR-like HD superfamily hydrolase